jgi:hypothetical protein
MSLPSAQIIAWLKRTYNKSVQEQSPYRGLFVGLGITAFGLLFLCTGLLTGEVKLNGEIVHPQDPEFWLPASFIIFFGLALTGFSARQAMRARTPVKTVPGIVDTSVGSEGRMFTQKKAPQLRLLMGIGILILLCLPLALATPSKNPTPTLIAVLGGGGLAIVMIAGAYLGQRNVSITLKQDSIEWTNAFGKAFSCPNGQFALAKVYAAQGVFWPRMTTSEGKSVWISPQYENYDEWVSKLSARAAPQ